MLPRRDHFEYHVLSHAVDAFATIGRLPMALWQLQVEVIPAERVGGRSQIDPAEFNDAFWWSDRQPPSNYRDRLALLLPPIKAWHQQMLWYGQEQSDRIEIWLEKDLVEYIEVRIDCRAPNVPFLDGLLRMAQDWSCALIEKRYLKVLPTTLSEFMAAVAESPSYRFMEDPAYWLPKLAAEVQASDGSDVVGYSQSTPQSRDKGIASFIRKLLGRGSR